MPTAQILVGNFAPSLELLTFDDQARTLTLERLTHPNYERYTWLTPHPRFAHLVYGTQVGTSNGTLTLFEVKDVNGSIKVKSLQSVNSGGVDPCHAGVSTDATEIAIANYNSSTVAVYKLRDDGWIQEDTKRTFDYSKLDKEFEHGPVTDRQEAPHPHGCFYSQKDGWLFPDLGSDKIRSLKDGVTYSCKPGAGPRHIALHPNGKHFYAVNELDNTLVVHTVGDNQAPAESQRISILPSDIRGSPLMNAAAVVLTSDSRHVYVTNRLEGRSEGDAVVCFSISEDGASIERKGEYRTGLDHPRCAHRFAFIGQDYLIIGSKTQTGAVIYACKPDGSLEEVARNNSAIQPSAFVLLSD